MACGCGCGCGYTGVGVRGRVWVWGRYGVAHLQGAIAVVHVVEHAVDSAFTGVGLRLLGLPPELLSS